MFILEMVYGELVPATLQTALMALGCAAEKNGTILCTCMSLSYISVYTMYLYSKWYSHNFSQRV